MKYCQMCPRKCKINRDEKLGFCGTSNNIKISKVMLHMWEEPIISGGRYDKLYENFYPVIYSEKRGDLFLLSKNDDKTPTEEDIWQMYFNGLLRKDIIWKDQQEWRLILYGNLIEQNPISFYKIKKVYLGNRMPLKERKKIVTYCRKNNIEYVGLLRKPNSYDLVECKGDCYNCAKNKKQSR